MVSKQKLLLAIYVFLVGSLFSTPLWLPSLGRAGTLIFAITGITVSVIVFGLLMYITNARPPVAAKPDAYAEKNPIPTPPQPVAGVNDKVAHVLSLLQKKGRLIDFFQEDISAFDDKQIGNAVRSIHKGCKEALVEYMKIEPIMNETEGREITVGDDFDPSAIRLTGNVSGKPPFKGVLRHCGWRLSSSSFPELPKNQDLSVIEPAEVEII